MIINKLVRIVLISLANVELTVGTIKKFNGIKIILLPCLLSKESSSNVELAGSQKKRVRTRFREG
jgi:hypothetical protein